jgi:hypothetical protein
MNSDSESLHPQSIAWLLSINAITHAIVEICKDVDRVESPLDAEAYQLFKWSARRVGRGTLNVSSIGEIYKVQQRFQAVVKRRLQNHIQENPPLFPWETQLVDYPERVDEPAMVLVSAWGWAAQQCRLHLPILLPDKIFKQLVDRCQELVGSSLPLGAKLVQAVESFFPEDSQAINDVAGLVLRSNYRSGEALETMPNLESHYSDLQPRQQMALSLLAAKHLLESLTLPVSITNPVVERQWLTTVGVLTLKVHYQFIGRVLKVKANLPSKGVLRLQADSSQAIAQSGCGGDLSVELSCTQKSPTYTLEVELEDVAQQPLSFVIVPTM